MVFDERLRRPGQVLGLIGCIGSLLCSLVMQLLYWNMEVVSSLAD